MPQLEYNTHLQAVAQGWADRRLQYVGDGEAIASHHNPNLYGDIGWRPASELLVRNTGGANMDYGYLLQWMHTWWTNSEGHRPWMLDERYTQVGYGFVWSTDNTPYAVTVLSGDPPG